MAALCHGEFAQSSVIQTVLMLIAPRQQAECRGWSEVTQRAGPLGPKWSGGAVIGARLCVGIQAQHVLAQARIDGHGGARKGAQRRTTADVYGLAEIQTQAQGVGDHLRPEHAACAAHGRGKDQAVNGAFFDTGAFDQ